VQSGDAQMQAAANNTASSQFDDDPGLLEQVGDGLAAAGEFAQDVLTQDSVGRPRTGVPGGM
jgi:hypothetical protein